MKHLRNEALELEDLKRELELSMVPETVERKLRQVYAELPEELPMQKGSRWFAGKTGSARALSFPVKKRPLGVALKTAACTAASLAAAFLLMFGVNAVNPALAESIPGIGSLFAALNDSKHPMGSHVATYPNSVQGLNLPMKASVDSGYGMTVEEAFCDGKYLYLTLRETFPKEAEQYDSVSWGCEGESDYEYRINGQAVELSSTAGRELGDDRAVAWVFPLPEEAENGERVDVSLRIGKLYGIYPNYKNDRRYDEIQVGLSAEFSVTADTTKNSVQELSAEDNGVKLYSVEHTPGYLLVDMEIPFWGREGDELLSGGGIKGYAMLFTEDGQELGHNYDLGDYDFANEDDADTIRGTWAFDGPPEQSGKVILRVLEDSPDSRSGIGSPDEEEKPLLFAEFTIDWKNGTAESSETYLKEGYVKADTEEYLNAMHHADFTGGYLVQDLLHTHDMWHDSQDWIYMVQMLSDVEYQPVEVRFYKQDELVGTVAAHPESEYNDEEFGEGNWPAYRDETGFYTAFPAQEATDGQARYGLLFVYYYPEDAEMDQHGHLANSEHVDRVDLVNRETGEVLLENLKIGDAYSP